MITFTDNSPGISDVAGFLVAGAGCDIRNKNTDRLDTALIVSKTPCSHAGVFTTNDIKAAPVRLCQARLTAGKPIHGIIANSGNANACTGEQGVADAARMVALAEQLTGSPSGSFYLGSTGRIGDLLPMAKVEQGIAAAAARLASTEAESRRAAEAILTSDTRPKTATARFTWQGKTVAVAGIAKGAGMIEPGMATMLAFVATDAAIPSDLLQACLRTANGKSFNTVTVDGDMSTNDTVVVLANGASGVSVSTAQPELLALFQEALDRVTYALADKIVGDGEKITKVVSVQIKQARTAAEAEKIARAIGNSLLVKSSWYGEDPNWGRLMDAAGYARVGIVEEKISIAYNDVPALVLGRPIPENKPAWKAEVKARRFTITLSLGLGTADYTLLATDLSEAYVSFNKSE